MNHRTFVFSLAWIAALLMAAPAMGQLLNHPVEALPLGDAVGTTFAGTQYARGLNDNSGKFSSFGIGVGRATERVSFMGMAGYSLDYPLADNNELSLAANVAVHLLSDDSMPVQVSVQGGLGWSSFADQAVWRFPIGVALQARPSGNATEITPWVMPRLDITRAFGSTSTDIGAAAGIGVSTQSGAGAHLAVDWVNVEGGAPFGFSIGVHFNIN